MSYNSPLDRGSLPRIDYRVSTGAVDPGLPRRDLAQFGSFLVMGLIGIVLASLVNIFIGSTALQFAISVIGVLVFTGLTAWDTQRINEVYLASDPGDALAKKALIGALSLYLDFINLFVLLLQLTGQRRE